MVVDEPPIEEIAMLEEGEKEEEPEPEREPEIDLMELKRRRARGMYQNTENEEEQVAMLEACTWMREVPCRWFACTSVLNSLENVVTHLHEVHAQEDMDLTTCMWDVCGESFASSTQLALHAETHVLGAILCPYQDLAPTGWNISCSLATCHRPRAPAQSAAARHTPLPPPPPPPPLQTPSNTSPSPQNGPAAPRTAPPQPPPCPTWSTDENTAAGPSPWAPQTHSFLPDADTGGLLAQFDMSRSFDYMPSFSFNVGYNFEASSQSPGFLRAMFPPTIPPTSSGAEGEGDPPTFSPLYTYASPPARSHQRWKGSTVATMLPAWHTRSSTPTG
ncbi:hypothetical protein B0H14DRAFT_3643484 [Mycena olivaceomarginata]|nr:hypothetical protein B0H14DRAFT_3643484 [Mycena olivaceomarginata]